MLPKLEIKCLCCPPLLGIFEDSSKGRKEYAKHIQTSHPVTCKEYKHYREFKSAGWVKFLGGGSTDTCVGDTEKCIKEMALVHYHNCKPCFVWQRDKDFPNPSPGLK